MPMLGIMASAISGNLWAPSGAYDSISSVTLSASASTITFSGIPSTYTHLQIRCMALISASDNDYRLQFNGDTAANYSRHYIFGDGANPYASGTANETKILVGYNAATYTNATASIIDILDYANTNKYKTVRSLAGADKNGSGYMFLFSGNWRNTAAVTSISLIPAAGTFNTYSSFALYGVK